jgi:2-succinyl-5-enolpyruvyl-6-hydroxy-3-cyclohexene-1-carboxylate synthase
LGVADPNAFNEQTIKAFANDESVVVLTETTSNLHHPLLYRISTQLSPLCS